MLLKGIRVVKNSAFISCSHNAHRVYFECMTIWLYFRMWNVAGAGAEGIGYRANEKVKFGHFPP